MNRLTNTQITIIAVSALLCLGLPAGALAANLSKVVVSGSNGKTAKVHNGRLEVEAKVDGTVRTSEKGTLTTQSAAPADFFHATKLLQQGSPTCKSLLTAPNGSGLVLTQIRVSVLNADAPSSSQHVYFYKDASCSSVPLASVVPPGEGLTTIPLDPGFALDSGEGLYALVGHPNFFVDLFVDGYRVPASAVP